ncbi:hypothetical protein C9374_002148 [Naegleria lovaniensis]|uniref:Uncharacterized protein n=1 Tax=Naegleria lovaniensis TaxID=51637 RepID=A0AA88KLZ9_NAELO|nr:uncharacterized protein C9374_002148 [Naegleria lovaniensis]KAG2387113.1 hypothetical protein C9374_002148 [Naegleria lovaniensis]
MTSVMATTSRNHPNGYNGGGEGSLNIHQEASSSSIMNVQPSSSEHHQMIVNSYHKVKELYALSVSRYNQGKYFLALESFLDCKNLVELELVQQQQQSASLVQQQHSTKSTIAQEQRHEHGVSSSSSTIQTRHQASSSKQKNKKHKQRSNSDNKTILGKGHNERTTRVGHEERSLVKVEPSQQVTPVHIDESDNYYLYLYYQICFQLAKCHFKLGQLSKAIYYLYHQCSQCENITVNQEYSTLLQEVERMICFDKNIDANKISADDIEKFALEIQPIHFFAPAAGSLDHSAYSMLSSSTTTSSVGHDMDVTTRSNNNFSIFFSPYSIHNAKHASLPSTYSTDKRNDWQSIFLKYQKSVCK